MAHRLREFDWAGTPLGPASAWSSSLKSVVATCLRCPFQMAIYWGPELNCLYNDAERDVLGRLHPGALGLPARDLLRDSWQVVGPQLAAVMDLGQTTWAEDQPLKLDRNGQLETGYFTYSYSPIIDDDGGVGGVLLVTQDTTARVLAERRLDTLRAVAARSMDAVTARQACGQAAVALTNGCDVPFALVYLVDGEQRIASCAASSAHDGQLTIAAPTIPLRDTSDGVAALFSRLARGGLDGELVQADHFATVSGHRHTVPRRAFVTGTGPEVEGRLTGFVVAGVSEDLAFEKSYRDFVKMAATAIGRSVVAARAREAERARADTIEALERAKTALFTDASHELRTPLALILGHLERLLDEADLPSSAMELISSARRAAFRMLKLVNALLDFSRIETGERAGVFRSADVGRITREVAAMFRSTAERASLRLSVDCADLPVAVYVDADAWEQIVSNLVSNSLKFTRAGGISVRTGVDGDHLQLTVEDTGIGIAPEDLERVFTRFYRARDQRARTHDGLGIGLALVRELVRLHGGSVRAEVRSGGGTRIRVTVPLGNEDLPPSLPHDLDPGFAVGGLAALFVAEADGWIDSRPPAPAETAPGNGMPVLRAWPTPTARREGTPAESFQRVLVAEDDADMREYLRRLLEPHFAVQVAHDGGEARDIALRDPPDILISDVMMPGLDGFALMRELRADHRTSELPVMLVSARADAESTVEALDVGADDYIVKPFGARELLARVRAALHSSRVRADAGIARGRSEERRRSERELKALLNDLRAAQRRIAAAGDAERRRIERNLHDGAQQRLTAIRLELGLAREIADDDPTAVGPMLDELRGELDEALDELRELAHGLYPPLLASDGLYTALSAMALRAAIPVTVRATDVGRAPRSVESAAYFCCLEALQNAAKHAGKGARALVRLSLGEGVLELQVSDDGAGFDPASVAPGYGLINMHDRLDALGGHVTITSSPGRGTTVTGQIPLP
jgi:signal transduction histidine kinase